MRKLLVALVFAGCAGPSSERRAAEEVVGRSLSAPDVAERRLATRITAELSDPVLDPALGPRLGDADATVRAIAASAVAAGVPAAREVLRAALGAPDPTAREAALDGVGSLSDGADWALRLSSDGDEAVRARAAWMLAILRAPEASARLTALASDPRPGVRAEALRALASLDAHGAARLAEAALADAALSVRLAALAALDRAGAEDSRLLALAGSDDRFLALRAALQLHRRGDRAPVVAVLERAAGDRRADVRAAAMNAAGELGERGQALARAYLGDPDLEVRLAAARAVLSSGGDAVAAKRVLHSALGTPFQLEAADELARLGDLDGRRALADAARAADANTRRAAVAALGALSPTPPALAAALGDPDARVRLTAARALLRRALRPYLR